jgi:alpha-L-fucosidase
MWTSVNGEGIYGTRPWKIYGEKPAGESVVKSSSFNEDRLKYSSKDIRFTTKGNDLYAFCLGQPTTDIVINSLGKDSKKLDKKIASVTLLGSDAKIHWKQKGNALVIKKDFKIPVAEVPVPAFKIEFK